MQHIAQTIETLRESQRRVNETILFLEQFQSGVDGVTLPPTPPVTETGLPSAAGEDRPAATPKGSSVERRASSVVPRGTAKRGKAATQPVATPALYQAVRTLDQPFTAVSLAEAAGAPIKQAQNFLSNRVSNQEFTRAGRGLFRCGPKFQHRDLTATRNVLPRNGKVQPPQAVSAPAKTTPALDLDKPDTIAGAIKRLLRGESQFTTALLLANLEADTDYRKLLEAENGRSNVSKALSAWVAAGHLVKEGRGDDASYQITASGKEWFGA